MTFLLVLHPCSTWGRMIFFLRRIATWDRQCCYIMLSTTTDARKRWRGTQLFVQYAQKCHMHINSTCHFFKITFMSILNIILKSGHINIALLNDKISNKCHNIPSIGALTCFIDTLCLINTNRF